MTFSKSGTVLFLLLILVACAPKSLEPVVLHKGVRFFYSAPSAKSVAIAGSFNHWDPDKDRLAGPDKNGVWTVVLPLAPGRYEYRFVVDGTDWVPDPSSPTVDDGLGGLNSLLVYEQ